MSWTAGIIYSLLLYRAQLSKKNCWIDSEGRIYIKFSNSNLAKAINACENTARNAMNELEKYGLIERKSNTGAANTIYLKVPDESEPCPKTDTPPLQKTVGVPCQKIGTPPLQEIGGVPLQESDGHPSKKLAPRYKEIDKKKREKPPRQKYGSYGNVLLTEAEYQKLQTETQNLDNLIEQLSTYMESTGKCYKNHAATLRNWIARENQKKPPEKEWKDLT